MSLYQPKFRNRDGSWATSPTWWVRFTDHMAVPQRIQGFTDKRVARELEDKLEKLVHVRAMGTTPSADLRKWCEKLLPRLREKLVALDLLDRKHVAAAAPIEEHVQAWEKHLEAKGTSKGQRMQVAFRVRAVIEGCGFQSLLDLDATAVEQFLKTARERKTKPLGARTSDFYVQAIRQFGRWAYKTELLSEEPLRSLELRGGAESDRKRERRALTFDELRTLLERTASGPELKGMSGAERSLLYWFVSETGLRRNEVRTLAVADLDVSSDEPGVRVRAANTKNGKEARLPLDADLARVLASHVEGREATARVFATPKHWRAAEMLYTDLEAAEIKVKDDAGTSWTSMRCGPRSEQTSGGRRSRSRWRSA